MLRKSGGRSASLSAALLMGLALGGCIRPLYGTLGMNSNVAGELQAITIDPIPDRLGHYLGNELIFALNGTGAQVQPRYRLVVTVRESVQTALLDTVSGRPSAGNVMLNADYTLLPVDGGEPITKGSTAVVAGYDRTSQRFANLRAARDAEIRDAKRLADEIRTRLAAALAAKG